MPAPLDVPWKDVQRVVEAGMPLAEAAERYGLKFDTVKKRAQRERWLTDTRIKTALAERVKTRGTKNCPVVSPESLLSASLEESGDSLRRSALAIARAALESVSQAGGTLKIESWQDFKTATETGMKAAGLDQQPTQQVQILIADSPAKIIDASE